MFKRFAVSLRHGCQLCIVAFNNTFLRFNTLAQVFTRYYVVENIFKGGEYALAVYRYICKSELLARVCHIALRLVEQVALQVPPNIAAYNGLYNEWYTINFDCKRFLHPVPHRAVLHTLFGFFDAGVVLLYKFGHRTEV